MIVDAGTPAARIHRDISARDDKRRHRIATACDIAMYIAVDPAINCDNSAPALIDHLRRSPAISNHTPSHQHPNRPRFEKKTEVDIAHDADAILCQRPVAIPHSLK